MESNIKRIPITTAKEISKLGYDEVIIVGANYESGIQHVTTYGKSQAACENAAQGGNAIKRLLKWPEEKCNDKPKRQIKREQIDEILNGIVGVIDNPDMDDKINLSKFAGFATLAKKYLNK